MIIETRMIGKYLYKAIEVDPQDPRLEGNDGLCDTKLKMVYISETPAEHQMPNLLEHEFGHAFLHENHIRDLDSHFEHVLVESIADYIEGLLYEKEKA